MPINKLINPVVKWVGGKRQLLSEITPLLPRNIRLLNYVEPFLGGGAVFFHLRPNRAILNDFNSELINVYEVIKNDLQALIEDLHTHKNNADYFYEIRSLDRSSNFNDLSNIKKASRIIYLNKTCFNGLYRVNNAGEFNSPFGKYKNPNIINEPTLKAVNKYLNENHIIFHNSDYEHILNNIEPNSFVYLDPPYDPISHTSNFTGYIQGGWNQYDQVRLRNACRVLHERGINFLLSNSSSQLIQDLYQEFNISFVKASRLINSDATKRGDINEVLIRNYE